MKAPISRFTVNGNSMNPTLKDGQDVLSVSWFVNPKVGDLVIVNSGQVTGNREIVKRIQKIDGDKVWVEGDNKEESTDSRDFGPVNLDQVIGKVIYASSHPDMIDCPSCSSPVIGIYGRKDAICSNCGYKLICCGE